MERSLLVFWRVPARVLRIDGVVSVSVFEADREDEVKVPWPRIHWVSEVMSSPGVRIVRE